MHPVSRLSLVSLTVTVVALLQAGGGLAARTTSTLWVKTSGDDSAPCTAAAPCRTINHAVSVAQPGDTIKLGPGSYPENDGVHITNDLTIDGGWFLGTTVELGWYFSPHPVFWVNEAATVTLKNMTISGGNQGGINNQGTLTLENVWVRDNTGDDGILNHGSLTTRNLGVDHNAGGAGLNNSGTAVLFDTHVDGTYQPGFLPPDGIVNTGALIVSRGLIAGNAGRGLAQFNPYGTTACPQRALLINVTISGNAGGVDARCGQLGFRHVTIAANTAVDGGAGGLWNEGTADVVLQNSIVAGNSKPQCKGAEVSYSFIGDSSCGWPSPAGFDPKLGALAPRPSQNIFEKLFHIGATKVHALLPGSSAIDAASDAYCTDIIFGDWLTDQLGQPRPVDGNGDGVAHCDMGAYEYQPSVTASNDTR